MCMRARPRACVYACACVSYATGVHVGVVAAERRACASYRSCGGGFPCDDPSSWCAPPDSTLHAMSGLATFTLSTPLALKLYERSGSMSTLEEGLKPPPPAMSQLDH